jgi:tetratricopeptide (TPR) repeat protein
VTIEITHLTIKMAKILLLNSFLLLAFHNGLNGQELSAEQVYSKINDAVVTIYTFDQNSNPLSQGSGVIINEKGWVITNYHVYEGASKILIKHKNKIVDFSKVLCLNPERDILILKLVKNDFPQIKIANSNAVKVGQKIYAIGSPFGLENTISEGIVSGIRGSDELSKNFIQISASISSGSSGGAVIDSKGQLIGITTMTFSKGQNLNFAIPINEILTLSQREDIKEKEGYGASLFFKAMTEYKKENFNLAIQYLENCITYNPKLVEAYYYLGVIYMDYPDGNEIKITTAIKFFEKALKINPTFTRAYFQLGFIYSKINQTELGIVNYKKAIQSNPSFLDSYYELAFIYIDKENFPAALKSLLNIVSSNPDYNYSYYGNIYYGLGLVYNELKKPDSAILHLDKAVSLQKMSDTLELSDEYYQLGKSFSLNQNDADAIKYFKLSVSNNSSNSKAYFNLGYLYDKNGDLDNAIDSYKKTIALTPDNPVPYFNLSFIYGKKGDTKLQQYYRSKAGNLDSRFKQ